MDRDSLTAILCRVRELQIANEWDEARKVAVPVTWKLNEDIQNSVRFAKYLKLSYRRVHMSSDNYLLTLKAPGIDGGAVDQTFTLGWNMAFGDQSNTRTFLGHLVRTAKRYSYHDSPPDVLSIRAVCALAAFLARDLEKELGIDVITAMPSRSASANELPNVASQFVANVLDRAVSGPEHIKFVREVEQMKVLETTDAKHHAVSGSMKASSVEFEGKRILVIDDMLESGASLSEAGRALKAAGATGVVGMTLARTRSHATETMSKR